MTRSHFSDELAQAYVDGALSDREAERCSEHARTCAECRLLVESYRALASDLEALPSLEPELDFTRSVMAVIDEKEHAAAVSAATRSGWWGSPRSPPPRCSSASAPTPGRPR